MKGCADMGRYINPGNEGFRLLSKENYVDKTGILGILNDCINTSSNLICISRPRRFGKSYAVKTICAYYDCSVDSHEVFDGFDISKTPQYEDNINKYNVIRLDMTEIVSRYNIEDSTTGDLIKDLCLYLKNDICTLYPTIDITRHITDVLYNLVKLTQRKIVFVIDEWDAVIREFPNDDKLQQKYLELLRSFFKSSTFTPDCIAAAYMTGILPIKKNKSQSAISDFKEYTVISPGKFAGFIGFNESEVRILCDKADMDFDRMKWWYDGYTLGGKAEIYNPYSVMSAIENHDYGSYWQQTSAAESLKTYINMNFKGLQEDILRLLSGEELEINPRSFKNDFMSFETKNEVLTLLTHLGYLTYNKETQTVHIPNEEIRFEFKDLLENTDHTRLADLVNSSQKLLADTFSCNEKNVLSAIENIRQSEYASTFYNDEQALRYVIKFAYIVCVDIYMKVEELPSGKGIADVVFIPKKRTPDPAIIVELKWNKTADAAIAQIKTKNYPKVLESYSGEMILVGINYDDKTKEHSCKIEKIQL